MPFTAPLLVSPGSRQQSDVLAHRLGGLRPICVGRTAPIGSAPRGTIPVSVAIGRRTVDEFQFSTVAGHPSPAFPRMRSQFYVR